MLQLGTVQYPNGYNQPLNGYSYIIGAGFICWISRGIEKTPFLKNEYKQSKKVINGFMGIALAVALIGVINVGVKLVIDPADVEALFYMEDFVILVDKEVLLDWIQAIGFIFGTPLVLTIFGDGILFVGSEFSNKVYSLFVWDDFPKGKDEENLKNFLVVECKLKWVASAEIEKKGESKTCIKKDEQHAEITKEGGRVFLKLSEGEKRWELGTQEKNSKLYVNKFLYKVEIYDEVV